MHTHVVSFGQIDRAIAVLKGRLACAKAQAISLPDGSPAKSEEQQTVRRLSEVVYRLSAIREGLLVDEPEGYLH